MSLGRVRPAARWLLLFGIPGAALAAGELAEQIAWASRVPSAVLEVEQLAGACRRFLEELSLEALGPAETARERGLEASSREAGQGRLARRIEGIGLLDSRGELLAWEGSPAASCPPSGSSEPGPSWKILIEGLRTSLLACSAPDPVSGRVGVASILLDGPSPGVGFHLLVPRELRAPGSARRVEWLGFEVEGRTLSLQGDAFQEGSQAAGARTWRVPIETRSGQLLATALLREVERATIPSRARAQARALAAVFFLLLLASLVPWPSVVEKPAGWAAASAAILFGRAILLACRAPAVLLPRELGSPTLFGAPGLWGALASPADLLLTCVAGYLLAEVALKTAKAGPVRASGRLAAGAAGAVAATAGLVELSRVLAREARLGVLDLESALRSPGHLVLLLAVLWAVLSAAIFWTGLARACFPWAFRSGKHREELAVFSALVPICCLVTIRLLGESDELALERLRSEFAPKILEQAARRRLALVSAVTGAATSPLAIRALTAPAGKADPYTAYRLWVEGDLYHGGFASSLDLYDLSGTLRSRFSFDLPPVGEPPPEPLASGAEPPVEAERFRVGAGTRWVQHLERPIVAAGQVVGAVVGHVVDEPDNLPFLTWVAPYLLALGPGAPRFAESFRDVPGYVRYDRDGAVVVTTVHAPPALSRDLEEAASRGRSVRLKIGGEEQIVLPLAAEGDFHLLLRPARSVLDRAGAFLRLLLLAMALAGVRLAVRSRPRAGERMGLFHLVRSSFYRKLLASLLLASVLPVLALAFFLQVYVEKRGEASLMEAASGLVRAVQRQVEDYAELVGGGLLDDGVLSWLRRVIGQEIHLYTGGLLQATSKRELFASGLLSERLPGDVERRVVRGGLPYLVRTERLGPNEIPVAYARVELPALQRDSVVAVPLILEQQETARAVDRVEDMLLLATIVVCGLPAGAGALLARRAARPLRDLAAASSRIASGDYTARLQPATRDEVAALVEAFNRMAESLGAQREDLLRRRDYIEALLRHATTGVISTDAKGRVVTVNPAAANLLAGFGAVVRPGEDLTEALANARGLRPLVEALEQAAGTPGTPREVDLERERERRRIRLVRVGLPEPDRIEPGSLILLDDVTELMRSNQLAAWAEMARAIAHEIKNPLTPILLSAEHLGRVLEDRGMLPSAELEGCLQTILKQVESLRDISAEFSAYAKLPALDLKPHDPAAFLREVVAPYLAAPPRGIEIEEVFCPAPPVRMDRRVLARAVVNLVENAIEAMPGRGRLRVGVERADDGFVVLFVSDTGPGLDPAVRQRLFEPYFSTKSSGTGLGLAIARRTVEAHGGRIEVESESGHGTTFRILLPPA